MSFPRKTTQYSFKVDHSTLSHIPSVLRPNPASLFWTLITFDIELIVFLHVPE